MPAREVLAYAMLDAGDAAGALREFELGLEREPNRLRGYAGAARAAERAGDAKKAADYSSRLVELTKSADTQLHEIAYAKSMLRK